jgi:hypothetical protein
MLRGNSLDADLRAAIDAGIAMCGGIAHWRVSPDVDRAYALLEFPGDADTPAIETDASFTESAPIIALAVYPAVAEALPSLIEVLDGPGRPSGVIGCRASGGAAVLEWDLDRTPATLVLDLIDTELDRFHSGRRIELLTPLTETWLAKIAADGLHCPEIASDRILETLVTKAGLDV